VLAVGARPRLHSERLRDDPAEIHRCLRSQPRDADLLHALFGALQRGDDLDRRWCIAHALSYLGEANQQELDLYHAHRAEGLIRPTRAVNEDEWFELLSHPDEDLLTSRILAEIAPTMLLGAIPALRESIAPSLVNPEEKVDLQNSTLQAGRCIGWAARILGIDAPTIYASPSWQGTIDMVLTPRPCSRLGGSMLSGRSNAELAFFAGRHLCWYRREHVLARPRQVRRALDDMFLVGLIIGNPGLPLKASIRDRISPMAAAVRKLLDSAAINRLAGLFRDFVAQGGKTNLNDWVVGVERTAACSGLLLCNDLQAAEAAVGLDTREPQAVMDELVLFHTAGRCTMLRKRIGVAIAGSSSR
jgi:golgin subfamily B member 1